MIALISDIHGNYVALAEVLGAIDGLNVEATYCLGDVVGYYPQVNECCAALRQHALQSVLGNHEWHMISGTLCPRSNAANDCLRYRREIITETNPAWIASFPVYRKIGGLALLHGGWTNPLDEYLAPTEEQFRAILDRYCASGHTQAADFELR